MDRLLNTPLALSPAGIDVEPFRGVRFSEDVVGDLAAVTSPPYDVVDAAGVRSLESTNAHNVVRLILPRDDDCGPEGRYRHAAATLRSWLSDGTLLVDDEAGLYVYEQSLGGQVLQRGFIGAVALRDPAELVILPHEYTMPGPVADRLELMRAGEANIEPIFLMYEGGRAAEAELDDCVAGTPLIAARTGDGIEHKLWAISEQDRLAAVRGDLAGRTAMIADGHHRYAAYRALQSERRATDGPGPWDFGLALLVDLAVAPPVVGAIHRTMSGLTLQQALGLAAGAGFDVAASDVATSDGYHDESWAARLVPGEWVLVDASGASARLTVSDAATVGRHMPKNHSAQWRALDTAVLHHALIEAAWAVPEESIGYHHTVAGAIAATRDALPAPGLAILMAPVDVGTVFALAAAGEMMPRKSTSFGPKPRTGWVLRTFDA